MKKILFLLSIYLCYSVIAYAQKSGETQEESQATVQSRHIQQEKYFFAKVDYARRYRIFAQESGIVEKNFLQDRKTYEANTELLHLKNPAITFDVLQSRVRLSEAQQELQAVNIGIKHGRTSASEKKKIIENIALLTHKVKMAEEAAMNLVVKIPFKGKSLYMAPALYAMQEQNVTHIKKGDFVAEFVVDENLVLKGHMRASDQESTTTEMLAFIETGGKRIPTEILSAHYAKKNAAETSFDMVFSLPNLPQFNNAPLGLTVPIIIQMPKHYALTSIPRTFLQYKGNLRFCYRLRDGSIEEIPVMTGEFDNKFIEVFGKLQLGDTVLRNAQPTTPDKNKK